MPSTMEIIIYYTVCDKMESIEATFSLGIH